MRQGSDFWSRRREAVAAEADAEREAIKAGELAQERAALDEKTDQEILETLNLKNPDTLEHGDDFSGFLNEAVPERLRQRALRRLWLSNPALANVDGLVEYGDDFTDAATVIEGMQTAYQVGKGMLKHLVEVAEPDEPADTVDGAIENVQPEAMTVSEETEAPLPEEAVDADETLQSAAEETHVPHEAPTRRRMRFAFAS